jgi:hypothetical protein
MKKPPTMNSGTCEICGRVIVLTAFDVCWNCREQRLAEMESILNYIKDHRNANITDVAKAAGVDPQLVLRLMQKGSLQVRKGPESQRCQTCHRPIEKGRFCDKCAGFAKPAAKPAKKK